MLPKTAHSDPPKHADSVPLSSLVGRLARAIEEALPPGDVAALRRARLEDGVQPAYFKVAALYLEPADAFPEAGLAVRDRLDNRWAAILSAMATMKELHDPQMPLGKALAQADYAETRLLRLLRGRGDALFDAVRVASHFLVSKAQRSNHTDVAWLILSDGRADEEMVRRRIARDYYGQSNST